MEYFLELVYTLLPLRKVGSPSIPRRQSFVMVHSIPFVRVDQPMNNLSLPGGSSMRTAVLITQSS